MHLVIVASLKYRHSYHAGNAGDVLKHVVLVGILRRLAQRNGFACYVQPEPITGLDQGFFQPPEVTPGLPQAVINVGMGSEGNVSDFSISYDMTQPTGAIGLGLDAANKSVLTGIAPVSTLFPMGAEPALTRVLHNKWYVDELYDRIVVQPILRVSRFAWRVIDQGIVDGIVNGVGNLTRALGWFGSLFQTGAVNTYALILTIGVIVILGYIAF